MCKKCKSFICTETAHINTISCLTMLAYYCKHMQNFLHIATGLILQLHSPHREITVLMQAARIESASTTLCSVSVLTGSTEPTFKIIKIW